MQLKAELTTYNDSLAFLGFDVTNGKCKARVCGFIILYVATLINTVYFVVDKWEDVDNRIKGLKAITFYTLIVLYSLVIIFKWSDTKTTLDLIYAEPYPFPYRVTQSRRSLMKSINDDMIKQNSFWRNAVLAYSVFGVLLPLLSIGKFMITTKFSDFDVKKLSLTFPIYYPENYDTFSSYTIGYITQTMFVLQLLQYGYFGTSSFAAMLTVEGELNLLKLSVEEMEEYILSEDQQSVRKHNDHHKLDSTNKRFPMLQLFLQYFVNHHQATYTKVSAVTKGIQGNASLLNFGVSIYICMALYNISQKQEILWKIQEAFDSFLWLYDIYCLDYMSERIYTADKNLQNALYNCLWFEKPKFFKKSLQIVMTRANKSIQIRPVGLFVLSLKNYAKCINAAYSYYNILNNLKTTP